MAYVTPTTVLTNDLIAAGDWNKNTVDNPIALRTGEIALTSQAVGDLVIATSATQLGRVADVAVGQVLVSGGVTTAPAYSASPSITALTYTTSLKSTTALATPGALSATQATAFASTVSGAAIMGFGTTNDVSLMNRAGTVVLGVGPNTTTVNMTGALSVAGLLTVDGDFYTVAYTDYASTSSITGWSSFTSGRKHINYKKIGKIVFVSFHLEGTSNTTTISFTLPYASVSQYGSFGGALTFTYDNTVAKTTAGRVDLSSANAQANCFSDAAAGTWTASGTKIVTGSFWYQTT